MNVAQCPVNQSAVHPHAVHPPSAHPHAVHPCAINGVYGALTPMVTSPLDHIRQLRESGAGNVLYMGENDGVGFYQLWKPEHARHVLQKHEKNYVREPTGARFAPMSIRRQGPHSEASHTDVIVGIDGDDWQEKRKSLRASFTRKQASDFADLAADCYAEAREGGRPLFGNTSYRCFELMFSAILRYTLSLQPEDSVSRGVWRALPGINRYFHNGLFTNQTIMNEGYDQDFSFCRDFFSQALDARIALDQQEPRRSPDLFTRVSQRYDLDNPDDRDQLYTDILSVSLAGSDAPSLSLAWILYAIAANPEVRHRLAEEVEEVLEGRTPTQADLSELRYTQAVVRETLRLYPPAWYTPRTNVEDDELDGVRIPAGSTVIVFQYLMHHDPQFWQDPSQFRPERFLDSSDHPAYMPYGWGPRYCFAADYAHLMMTAFTALIFRDHDLELKTLEPPRMDPLINLRMKDDLYLEMKPRT